MAGKARRSDEVLIAALAAGEPLSRAARQAGISERTAHRRMSEAAFRTSVGRVRGEMLGRTIGIVSCAAADAAETLRKLLRSNSDAVRLGAARALLESLSRLNNDYEFEQRLTHIEQTSMTLVHVTNEGALSDASS